MDRSKDDNLDRRMPQPEQTAEKPHSAPSKSFWAAGPTLHYSHPYVIRLWMATIGVYAAVCALWSRVLLGEIFGFVPSGLWDNQAWNIGRFVVQPISIYEYPWQIVVLGTWMGIIAAVPILISQLYSFRYSLPMLIVALFVGQLYGLVWFLTAGAMAAACRPLRFRSRFIAVALCMAFPVLYWALWGGFTSADPLRWGFSYSVWLYAWLAAMLMSALVLGIGHFTRYRPGLVLTTSALFGAAGFLIFQQKIGFAELDYHLYVAGSNPERTEEFYSRSISDVLDQIIADDTLRSYLIGIFYPTEPAQLREKLKQEIQARLAYNQWPEWFVRKMPPVFGYQQKRRALLTRCRQFMERWPESRRMPIALYFTAMLNEIQPDVRYLAQTETLRFVSDYPQRDSLVIWQELFERFSGRPEALEARWRLAFHSAAEGRFERAVQLCQVTAALIAEQLKKIETAPAPNKETIWAAFSAPTDTVMTELKLRDLSIRTQKLQSLLQPEHRANPEAERRLATFVGLNPYAVDYALRLAALAAEIPPTDPLWDNVRLAQLLLISDLSSRAAGLEKFLQQTSPAADALLEARYELILCYLELWKQTQQQGQARNELLETLRSLLDQFLQQYGGSMYTANVLQIRHTLPAAGKP